MKKTIRYLSLVALFLSRSLHGNEDDLNDTSESCNPPRKNPGGISWNPCYTDSSSNRFAFYVDSGETMAERSWQDHREPLKSRASDAVVPQEGFIPGEIPGENPGATPGVVANFTPGVDGMPFALKKKPPDTVSLKSRASDAVVPQEGFIPGEIPGENPGATPGVVANFTPGVDGMPFVLKKKPPDTVNLKSRASDAIVPQEGFIPGEIPGENPGATPGVVANFTPGVDGMPFVLKKKPPDTVNLKSRASDAVVPQEGFIPGEIPGENPGATPGVVANFTPGVDGMPFALKKKPPDTVNLKSRASDAVVPQEGFIPGEIPGENPGATPGVVANFTPGVDGMPFVLKKKPPDTVNLKSRASDAVVPQEGFIPGEIPGENPGATPGVVANFTPGVDGMPFVLKKKPPDTVNFKSRASDAVVPQEGFIPGEIPGENPGATPGVVANFTPGVDGMPFVLKKKPPDTVNLKSRASDAVVPQEGFIPGEIPGENPGATPGVVANFTPGVDGMPFALKKKPPDTVAQKSEFTPGQTQSKQPPPGVIIAYTPGLNEYEITEKNREHLDPIAKNAHIKNSTQYRIHGCLESKGLSVTPSSSITGSGVITTQGHSVDIEGGLRLDHSDKLEIYGDLNESATATTTIANGSHITVHGSTRLGGGITVGPLQAGDKIFFLDSSGPIKGSYDSITIAEHPELHGRLKIIGDPMAYILAAPNSYTLFAHNQNQKNVAKALDGFMTPTTTDQARVQDSLDELHAGEYPSAFNQLMPTLYQSLSTIAFNIENAQNQELIQHLWGLRLAGGTGARFTKSGFSDSIAILENNTKKKVFPGNESILTPTPDNHWGMFVQGNGIFSQSVSSNLLPAYNTESGGVTTGISYTWNQTFSSGFYTGYEELYSKYSGGSSLVDHQVNCGFFGTYGQEKGKGFFLDTLAGGAYNNYQMRRAITLGSGENALHRTATGTPGGVELNTMVACGYDVKYGNWTFGPLSSLQYQYFETNSFSEIGAEALDLNVLGWGTSSLISSLGTHVAYHWQVTPKIRLIPQLSLSWQHQFLENPYTIESSFSGPKNLFFGNTSSAPLRDTFYTGVGATLEFNKNWESSLFYSSATGNKELTSQNIFWSLGFKF